MLPPKQEALLRHELPSLRNWRSPWNFRWGATWWPTSGQSRSLTFGPIPSLRSGGECACVVQGAHCHILKVSNFEQTAGTLVTNLCTGRRSTSDLEHARRGSDDSEGTFETIPSSYSLVVKSVIYVPWGRIASSEGHCYGNVSWKSCDRELWNHHYSGVASQSDQCFIKIKSCERF